jgi:hypothetical protein
LTGAICFGPNTTEQNIYNVVTNNMNTEKYAAAKVLTKEQAADYFRRKNAANFVAEKLREEYKCGK